MYDLCIKNKFPVTNPVNYRGITLLSGFCKLFNSISNNRLTEYIDELGIMGEEQTGFRHDYSTIDHVFIMKHFIDLYLNKRKRLYCAFVGYRKAFDTVNRILKWLKLLSNNIDGNIFIVIFNLYNEAKSCIMNTFTKHLSPFFPCNFGVRQGENISPLIFALFFNDLETHLSNAYGGLTYIASF